MTERAAEAITTERLLLAPLDPSAAAEMVAVLADPELYAFTGGEPPDLAVLEARYTAQAAGSPDPGERWHNWIVRLAGSGRAIGFVQTTVTGDEADLAWVIGVAWQGQGFAQEASEGMRRWLADAGTARFSAHIHPLHGASARVAAAIGLEVTDEVDDEGERVWRSLARR